jgi:hypothetical protein
VTNAVRHVRVSGESRLRPPFVSRRWAGGTRGAGAARCPAAAVGSCVPRLSCAPPSRIRIPSAMRQNPTRCRTGTNRRTSHDTGCDETKNQRHVSIRFRFTTRPPADDTRHTCHVHTAVRTEPNATIHTHAPRSEHRVCRISRPVRARLHGLCSVLETRLFDPLYC